MHEGLPRRRRRLQQRRPKKGRLQGRRRRRRHWRRRHWRRRRRRDLNLDPWRVQEVRDVRIGAVQGAGTRGSDGKRLRRRHLAGPLRRGRKPRRRRLLLLRPPQKPPEVRRTVWRPCAALQGRNGELRRLARLLHQPHGTGSDALGARQPTLGPPPAPGRDRRRLRALLPTRHRRQPQQHPLCPRRTLLLVLCSSSSSTTTTHRDARRRSRRRRRREPNPLAESTPASS